MFVRCRVLIGAVLSFGVLGLCGGCTSDPGTLAIQRALDTGFEAIRPDAELGVRVRSDPALAAAAGVPVLTPAQAEFVRETLDYHQRLIDLLKETELGTVDPDAPLPPGPTSRPPGP